jgi:hypothetical protein
MPDDKAKRGGQDRKRINVNEDYELRDWSERLGVPPGAVREAVAKVGDDAQKVRDYIGTGSKAKKG